MRYPLALVSKNQKKDKPDSHAYHYDYLSEYENRLFQQHFNLPEHPPFSDKIKPVLTAFHHTCCAIVPAKNSLFKRQQQQLKHCIEQVGSALQTQASTSIGALHSRANLRNYLMDYPLYSTLLLLEECTDDGEEKCWWLALLARIYLHNETLNYKVSFIFDRARESHVTYTSLSAILSVSDLLNITRIELQGTLKKLAHIHQAAGKLSRLFASIKPPASHSLFDTLNPLSREYVQIDDEQLTLHTNVDIDGEIQHQYLEIESAAPLSEKAKQLKFSKALGGKQNAIRRANIALPHSRQALTPLQLKQFVNHAMPQLITGKLTDITKETLPFFVIFWIEIWINKPFSTFNDINIFNNGAKALPSDSPGFYYTLDHTKYQHTQMFYQIETCLVKGKLPPPEKQAYYDTSSAKSPVRLTIPYPIQSLFNLLLRQVESHLRRKTNLTALLNVSDQAYKNWFNSVIECVPHSKNQAITQARIRQTFHHFIQDSVPNSDIALLKQVGELQSFYINTDNDGANYRLQTAWLNFLDILELDKSHRSTNESDRPSTCTYKNELQGFGAGLSIKSSYLLKITSFFQQTFNDRLGLKVATMPAQLSDISQRMIAYLHIRSAISAMVRPVVTPYPPMQHISSTLSCMTIRDKDTHHNQARRIFFFDTLLATLWARLGEWYDLQIFTHHTNTALSYHDGQDWISADKHHLVALMKKFNINIDANGYRHTGASLLVTSQGNKFQQSALNAQMNHFDYGQSPFRSYSLLSVQDVVAAQQPHLTALTALFTEADNALLALLHKLIKKKFRVTNAR